MAAELHDGNSVQDDAGAGGLDKESSSTPGMQDQRERRKELLEGVRSILVERRTREILDLYHDPEFAEVMKQMMSESFKAVIELSGAHQFQMLDSAEVESQIAHAVEQMFSDPDQMVSHAAQQAKREFMTREEYDHEFEAGLIDTLSQRGAILTDDIRAELKAHHDSAARMRVPSQEIMDRLTSIAESEGVVAAAAVENVHAVTRELFPTAEDYRRHNTEAFADFENFVTNLGDVLSRCEGLEPWFGEATVKTVWSAMKITEAMMEREIDQNVEAIYGGQE